MKQFRHYVPLFGALAIIVLFLKMPEAPNLFGIFKCKTCVSNDPYLPMIASGYFAVLIAISLLFPAFPSPSIARGGLIWAVLLSFAFTYISLPAWCVACLIAHFCNILMWGIWWGIPADKNDQPRTTYLKERLFLTCFAPICMIALFSSMNLTFLVYNLKTKQNAAVAGLKAGDTIPSFAIQNNEANRSFTSADVTTGKRSFINFVSPNCPFCKEQLAMLKNIVPQLSDHSYRFITVTPAMTPDLTDSLTSSEWFVDKNGQLRELFKVSGYPTLFVIEDGKILQVIAGASTELKAIANADLASK